MATPKTELVQYLTKGEYQPPAPRTSHAEHVERTGEPYSEDHHQHGSSGAGPQSSTEHDDGQQSGHVESQQQFPSASLEGTKAEAREEQVPPPPEQKKVERPPVTFNQWDAQR